MDVNNKFDELYFKEDILKEGDKLPNKIKNSLTKVNLLMNIGMKINQFIDSIEQFGLINYINENI